MKQKLFIFYGVLFILSSLCFTSCINNKEPKCEIYELYCTKTEYETSVSNHPLTKQGYCYQYEITKEEFNSLVDSFDYIDNFTEAELFGFLRNHYTSESSRNISDNLMNKFEYALVPVQFRNSDDVYCILKKNK